MVEGALDVGVVVIVLAFREFPHPLGLSQRERETGVPFSLPPHPGPLPRGEREEVRGTSLKATGDPPLSGKRL
jgi:hypothetical protein